MITYVHDEEFETLTVSGGHNSGGNNTKITVKGGATVNQYLARDAVSIAANAQAVGNSEAVNNISFGFNNLS